MKPALLELDSLDDRREVWRLLSHLPPADRWRFVRWAARSCPPRNGMSPELTLSDRDRDRVKRATAWDAQADRGIVNECYGHLWTLATQYGLPLDVITVRLSEIVRRKITLSELERQTCR